MELNLDLKKSRCETPSSPGTSVKRMSLLRNPVNYNSKSLFAEVFSTIGQIAQTGQYPVILLDFPSLLSALGWPPKSQITGRDGLPKRESHRLQGGLAIRCGKSRRILGVFGERSVFQNRQNHRLQGALSLTGSQKLQITGRFEMLTMFFPKSATLKSS